MKNSPIICSIVLLWTFVVLACQNNPLAEFTNQYNCQITGEAEPRTSEDYGKRAAKHLADNNFSAEFNECAFGAAAEAVRLDPNNADALALRGNLHFAHRQIALAAGDGDQLRKDLKSALADLDKAIELIPDRAVFYEIRAAIYEQSDYLDNDAQSEKTLENLTKAIELSSPSKSLTLLYAKRGDVYFRQPDYENAVKDFSEAIKLDATDAEFYSKRSEAYRKLGKEDLSVADEMKVFQLKDAKERRDDAPNKTDSDSSDNRKLPQIVSGGILNGKAIKLEKPVYPAAAKAVRAGGAVTVQTTIDEQGKVISASAVSGHPLLRPACESAVRASTFNPTRLGNKPVQVKGVVVYNITPE